MKIKEIVNQHRRDFTAIMYCEFCKTESINNSGYDDDNYHQNVIPKMKCKNCNESTLSKGGTIENTQTKYPEGFQV